MSDKDSCNINMKGGGKMECESSCCGSGGSCEVYVSSDSRRFFTKEEKVKMLQQYKEALEKEAKGVAERIEELNDK